MPKQNKEKIKRNNIKISDQLAIIYALQILFENLELVKISSEMTRQSLREGSWDLYDYKFTKLQRIELRSVTF